MFTQDENSTSCSKCGGTWILAFGDEKKRPKNFPKRRWGIWMDLDRQEMVSGCFSPTALAMGSLPI